MNKFGTRLKQLREKVSPSPKAFAQKIGIPYTTYRSYEKGASPSIENLLLIATALNTTTDELLGYELDCLEKCKRFVREAGWEINETHPEGCTTINFNLKELETSSPLRLQPIKDFYKIFPSGIVPTAIPNDVFIKLVSDAMNSADAVIKPSRMAIIKNALYISFLTKVAEDIQQMSEQKTPERSTNHE